MKPGPREYNEVFERLVRGSDDIEGFIAYGLYKQAKREWLIAFHDKHGAAPKPADLRAYQASWTDTTLQSLRENAESGLSAYAEVVIEAVKPQIERDALMAGRPIWKDLLIGAVAALVYSLLLLVAAYMTHVFGNDLAEAFRHFLERRGQT